MNKRLCKKAYALLLRSAFLQIALWLSLVPPQHFLQQRKVSITYCSTFCKKQQLWVQPSSLSSKYIVSAHTLTSQRVCCVQHAPEIRVLCFCWLLFFSFVLHRDNPLRFPSIIPSKRLSVLCGSAGRRPKSGINGERYSRPIFLLHGPYSKIFFLPPRKSEILFRVNLEITGTTRSTCRI